MDPPPDPPMLQYATPEEKPVVPTHPVVGVLGFLVYGGLFLLATFGEINLASVFVRFHPQPIQFAVPAAVITAAWAFTLWRATAALRGALRRPRKN